MKQIKVFALSCDIYLDIPFELFMCESQEWTPVSTNRASL